MDDDFQKAMQWVLNDLSEQTWRSFIAAHRGKYGERAFLRVGGYFNRTGYLLEFRAEPSARLLHTKWPAI
jgi:hypothetical protein